MMLRRPLPYIAASWSAAILIRNYAPVTAALGIGCALVVVWLVFLSRKGSRAQGNNRLLPALIVISFFAGLLCAGMYDQRLASDPALLHTGDSVEMEGTVRQCATGTNAKGEGQHKLQVDVEVINGAKVKSCGVLVTISEEQGGAPFPGLRIRFRGSLQRPPGKTNPGCFDYRMYLRTKGIQTTMHAETLQICGAPPGTLQRLQIRLYAMRESYLNRIGDNAGEETAGMLRAVLFGEKQQLDEEIREVFQKNGTAHILAVSGLHVGMIYGALCALWNLLSGWVPFVFGVGRGKRFFVCCGAFFLGYLFLAGYAPSVLRAVCMVMLHAFSGMTGRKYDLGSAACAVGTAAQIHNPYIIFQAGFQMSFLAILTLSLLIPCIHRFYEGVLAASLAIQIGLGPYILYQFNTLSLIAVLINVPVIGLASLLVPAGLLGMVLPTGAAVTVPYDHALSMVCEMMIGLNRICCIDHVTSLTAASPPLWVITAFYLGLLVFASEEGRLFFIRHRRRAAGIAMGLVLLGACLFGRAADDGFRQMDMVFVDVGQGDCIHLRSGGRNYLIDGGGSERFEVGTTTLQPYLLRNGVRRVDGAFVTHLHTDHYRGICELAKAGMIRRLFVYEANRLKLKQICEETGLDSSAVTFLRRGNTIRLSQGNRPDRIEVLWPVEKNDREYERMLVNEEDENAASLILRATIGGVSMLATGDLGEEGERQLIQVCREQGAEAASGTGSQMETGLSADILKVGHHGSKTSSCGAFLDAVSPAFAVIQVGEHNMYGHPTPEVLQRLEERRVQVYRNDLQGAVGFRINHKYARSHRSGYENVKEVRTMIR